MVGCNGGSGGLSSKGGTRAARVLLCTANVVAWLGAMMTARYLLGLAQRWAELSWYAAVNLSQLNSS